MVVDVQVALIGLIGVLAGSVIAGCISLVANWFLRRSEDARRVRMIALSSGLEMWQKYCDLMIEKAKTEKVSVDIGPADPFVAHMLRMAEIATDMSRSPTEASRDIDTMPLPISKGGD